MIPAAAAYWEERARRFARDGAGLRAVCSFGMPAFHNRAIHWTQRRALAPWLAVPAGTRVLEAGCGVGRWSVQLARRGAVVTGVDLAPTMIEEARRRAAAAGVADRCRFLVGDLADLDLGERFDLALGVTVLQHVLDPARLDAALAALSRHLAPGARAVLLEAAPSRPATRCDSPVFRARSEAFYRDALARAGLLPERVEGVDPAPFRVLLLPAYARLPRPVALALLALATGLALPVDLLLGRRLPRSSWHKLFVLHAAAPAARAGGAA